MRRRLVYVIGATTPEAAQTTYAFVRSYDSDGNHRWTHQLGTGSYDMAHGIATDGTGAVYVIGETEGDLSGLNAGERDAFIWKMAQ